MPRLPDLRDRALGVMLGMACGDALGAQVEFKARGTFRTPTSFRDGGPHRLRAGQWTDDTSMALALAEHMTEDASVARRSHRSLAERWVSWHRTGEYSVTGRCFDIGSRTAAALRHWHNEGSALSPSEVRPFPDGNGALMRVAPVGIRFLGQEHRCREFARWQGLLTHGRAAAAAAEAGAWAVARLMAGAEADEVVDEVVVRMRDHGMRDPKDLGRDDVLSGGHCLDTLEASLWCLLRSAYAEDAIVSAIALGHDTDTTAAVTGALAGARWGLHSLPARWTDKVAWRERLTRAALALLDMNQTGA